MTTDNREIYIGYLSKIVVFTSGINNTCLTIVRDFNADISKISPFGSILHDFCIENAFTIPDQEYFPADAYTYVSSPWRTTSWLNHMICTADALACISSMEVFVTK